MPGIEVAIQALQEQERILSSDLQKVQSALQSLTANGNRRKSANKKGIIIIGGRSAIRTVPTIVRATARGVAATGKKRRKLSAKGRAAISRAQKARWAKIKAAKAK
jgi:hypothetical protein